MKFKLCAVGLHFCLFAIILDAIDATYKVRNFRKEAAIDDKKCSQTVFVIMVKSTFFLVRYEKLFSFFVSKIVCFFHRNFFLSWTSFKALKTLLIGFVGLAYLVCAQDDGRYRPSGDDGRWILLYHRFCF